MDRRLASAGMKTPYYAFTYPEYFSSRLLTQFNPSDKCTAKSIAVCGNCNSNWFWELLKLKLDDTGIKFFKWYTFKNIPGAEPSDGIVHEKSAIPEDLKFAVYLKYGNDLCHAGYLGDIKFLNTFVREKVYDKFCFKAGK